MARFPAFPCFLICSLLIFLSTNGVQCYEFEEEDSDEVEQIEPGSYRPRNAEPLDVDFVSGPIGNPDDAQVELVDKQPQPQTPAVNNQRPQTSNGFPFPPGFPFHDNTGSVFHQSFGDFFGPAGGASVGAGVGAGTGAGGFNNWFHGFPSFDSFPKPWWQGPNVCSDRKEKIEEPANGKDNRNDSTSATSGSSSIDSNTESLFASAFHLNFESCVEKSNKHVCKTVTNKDGRVKTVTVTHQCCHGYSRMNNLCEKVDLEPIEETVEKLGAKEFMRIAKTNDLEDEMKKNVTIFAPLDSAVNAEDSMDMNLGVVPLKAQRRPDPETSLNKRDMILSHIVEDWINIEDIENEQLLPSAYNNTKIRMNIFPRPLSEETYRHPYRYTANCVPITQVNQLSENGIVHVIEKYLEPATLSIMELVSERDDMTILRSILEKTKLSETIDKEKAVTLFAPTDAAFQKLNPNLRKSLKEGNGCALNLLKNHILDITFCTCAVAAEAKTNAANVLGERLNFDRKKSNPVEENEIDDLLDTNTKGITINGKARITHADIMATNGVLHVIDSIIPTDSGLPITSTLEKQNLTIFRQLIQAGNLEDEFDSMSNVSFFVPSDRAFENSEWKHKLEQNPGSLKNNQELKKFLEYHVAVPMMKTCDFTERDIKTEAGGDLRINLYTTHPIFTNVMNRATVNCARLIHFDDDTCGSVMHQVDKILTPPSNNLYEQLEANENYSMFLRLIREANLTKLLQDPEQDITIFVPKNEVFEEVGEWYDDLLKNKRQLTYVVKSHIIPDALCCAGIVASDWPFIRSVETINNIHLKLDRDRRPKIHNAGVTKCDINTKNGIIHEINDVITVRQRQPQQQMQQNYW